MQPTGKKLPTGNRGSWKPLQSRQDLLCFSQNALTCGTYSAPGAPPAWNMRCNDNDISDIEDVCAEYPVLMSSTRQPIIIPPYPHFVFTQCTHTPAAPAQPPVHLRRGTCGAMIMAYQVSDMKDVCTEYPDDERHQAPNNGNVS